MPTVVVGREADGWYWRCGKRYSGGYEHRIDAVRDALIAVTDVSEFITPALDG